MFWSNPVRRGKRDTGISTPFTSWKNCKEVKETEVTVVDKKNRVRKRRSYSCPHAKEDRINAGLWRPKGQRESLVESSVKSNKEKWQQILSQGQVGLG